MNRDYKGAEAQGGNIMSHTIGMIVSGFPGVGKTSAASKNRDIEDCESSSFHYTTKVDALGVMTREENPNWVTEYVDHIKKLASIVGYPYILVSSHADVLDEMDRRGLPYLIVAPRRDAKDVYLSRYLKRGDCVAFIRNIAQHWDEWLDALDKRDAPVIHLDANQVLADILP